MKKTVIDISKEREIINQIINEVKIDLEKFVKYPKSHDKKS